MRYPFAVLYVSAGEIPRVESHHRTEAGARRAAERADRALHRHHPGTSLLCSYRAAERFGTDWRELGSENDE